MNFFKSFYDKYLDINLLDFEHIGFNLEINKVILFLAIALCIAFVGLYRHQTYVSHLLRRMLKLDAFGESKARSLRELKLSESKAIRRLVTNREGYLKRCLFYVGESHTGVEDSSHAEGQVGSNATECKADTDSKRGEIFVSAEEASDRKESGEAANPKDAAYAAENQKNPNTPAAVSDNKVQNTAEQSREVTLQGVPFLSDGLISPDAKLYIPEEGRDLAVNMLDKSNSSVPRLVLSCLLVVGISLALIFAMPEILPALNDFLAP